MALRKNLHHAWHHLYLCEVSNTSAVSRGDSSGGDGCGGSATGAGAGSAGLWLSTGCTGCGGL